MIPDTKLLPCSSSSLGFQSVRVLRTLPGRFGGLLLELLLLLALLLLLLALLLLLLALLLLLLSLLLLLLGPCTTLVETLRSCSLPQIKSQA